MGARFVRIVVRFCMNVLGVLVVLALTASSFDGTELAAFMFLALWFGVVEAAVALAKVEPPRESGCANVGILAVALVCFGTVSVQRAAEPKSDAVVAATCRSECPRAYAAIQRLRDRGI